MPLKDNATPGLIERRLSLRVFPPSGASSESCLPADVSIDAGASFKRIFSGRSSKLFRFSIVVLIPSAGMDSASELTGAGDAPRDDSGASYIDE